MNTQVLRSVAVRLAALHPADRRWMLAKLPQRHARPLRRLLQGSGLRSLLASRGGFAGALAWDQLLTDAPAPAAQIPGLEELDAGWQARWLALQTVAQRDAYLSQRASARAATDEFALAPGQSMPSALAAAIRAWPIAAAATEQAP